MSDGHEANNHGPEDGQGVPPYDRWNAEFRDLKDQAVAGDHGRKREQQHDHPTQRKRAASREYEPSNYKDDYTRRKPDENAAQSGTRIQRPKGD